GWVFAGDVSHAISAPTPPPDSMTNTHALGNILYTDYLYLFEASGMVLLVAMIGAIVLTHRQRPGVRKQAIADQLARHPEDTVEMRTIEPGKGI
ncbi:MAG: NADH-quinone oxidoreductase subunit J, partial [Rhodospirillales bacterium]|nr:NADH-quinone oxidoreductase subunit J [Rhodospirillales bacterium]